MTLFNSTFSSTVTHCRERQLLSEYLAGRFTYRSLEEWAWQLRAGKLSLNGTTAGVTARVTPGDSISLKVVKHEEKGIPTGYHILYRDERLLAVHKPAGLPVHGTGKIFFTTLVNLVRKDLGCGDLSPLFRLDEETSGIVIFGKGRENCRRFAPTQHNVKWLKSYVAVIRGSLRPARGIIDQALSEKAGNPIRCMMYPRPGGKPSLTSYEVIKERNGFCLVALSPITGRKHQLRAHLRIKGTPIVGDKIYSCQGQFYLKRLHTPLDENDYRTLGARHQLLHCFHVKITENGIPVVNVSDRDLPPEFADYFTADEVKDLFNSSVFRWTTLKHAFR